MEQYPFGRDLILDELFDLTLYQEFAKISQGKTKEIFEELIPIEEKHLSFWKSFFGIEIRVLNLPRRIKLFTLVLFGRLFGERAMHLILEAIEVYGIRKYLDLWKHGDERLKVAMHEILIDEFQHEDVVVSQMAERKIRPERVRNIFLGLNDGIVEIVGALSGFFAIFSNPATVLIASLTTAVAGSFSMAAGTYTAVSSETEITIVDAEKREFLEGKTIEEKRESPLLSAFVVGGSYFLGAMVPVLPVALGWKTPSLPIVAAGIMMLLVSLIVSFLSGMKIHKRIAMNLVLMGLAILVTYSIGTFARLQFGVWL